MATEQERSLTTTILVKNIHCRSCEANVYRTLQDLKPAIQDVQVNVLRQEIRIKHLASLDVLKACAALHDAAFDMHSLLTMDDEKKIQIREIEFTSENSWFDNIHSPVTPPIRRSSLHRRNTRLSSDRKASKHIENCESCKKEWQLQEKTERPSLDSKRKLQDLEAGDVGSLSLNDPFNERLDQNENGLVNSRSDTTGFTSSSDEQSKEAGLKSKEGKYEARLSVGGMTCASCTGSVTHSLSELPYVESVSVTLMTNSARVIFNGRQNLENLVEAVEEVGFECTVESCEEVQEDEQTTPEKPKEQRRTIMLKVDGMFCGHCPDQVRQAIDSQFSGAVEMGKVPSMKDPIMVLSYLPKAPNFTIREIIKAVDDANEVFTASVYTPPSIEERSQAMQRHESRRILQRLIISFLVGIPTLLIGVIWMSLVPASNSIRKYFNEPTLSGAVMRSDWALFFLATIVMFFAADIFHVRAFKEIRALWRRGSRVPILQRFIRFGSMNMLLSAGTSVAYFSSVAIIGINATSTPSMAGTSSTYFDSVVFLTFFILVGRWLEAYSRAKTGNAVAMLGNLRPEKVNLISNYADVARQDEKKIELPRETITSISSKLLEVDDIIQIPHGSSPPADGIVVKGATSFNESSLTGEARAVKKAIDDTVFAGSVNVGDAIQVKVEEVNGTSMLDQIISVVREGQTKRAPVERVVDTITGYFVPVITLLAIITFIIWLLLGTQGALRSRNIDPQQGGWTFWSLEFAIAVFVVACPCGIGLAAPTALFVGSGLAAKHGILVRGGGEAFQEASNIDCVVFDKTGTLTDGGNLQVTDHELLVEGPEAEAAWAITKALEETSSHPLAQALVRLANNHISDTGIITDSITEKPGRGVGGSFRTSTGTVYEARLGSEAFISSLIPDLHSNYYTGNTLSRWQSEAKSVALLAIRLSSPSIPAESYKLALIAAISDPIRSSAQATLAALRARNIPTYMLTGDNPRTASAVAATLSIPQTHVFAGVLPTEKAAKIRELQESTTYNASNATNSKSKDNNRKSIVAFVGDGINDAPALTAANVSISLASATDIALHSASFILLSPSDPLASIPTLIDLSQRVFRRVKINFAWALVYNTVLVPVAAGCLFWVKQEGWRLGPVWGSAAMALSSVCVVCSSLALRLEPGWVGRWWKRVWRRGNADVENRD